MRIAGLQLKNNVCLAPMAGITNLTFRVIAREFGCALAFTEMVSAHGLLQRASRSLQYMDSSSVDSPLGVQIFGSEADLLAEAARVVTARGADLLDINMGCPVKKVVKGGAGAALMRDPEKVGQILRQVRHATSLPLTAKIRSGWDRRHINAVEIARIAEDSGVDAVIIHSRTADQGFGGSADWNVIRQVKEALHIPVIGNGDIRNPEDALRLLQLTECEGVMVGRAALGNPWIFREVIARSEESKALQPPSLPERERMIRRHLDMEITAAGERHGVRNFRKHLLWYTKGLAGGAKFRNTAGAIDNRERVFAEVRLFFQSLQEEGATSGK